MKVKVSETVEVTDEQRAQIGETLGKKQASRDECRDYIWQHGSDWAQLLERGLEYAAQEAAGGPEPEDAGEVWVLDTEPDDAPIPGMELI